MFQVYPKWLSYIYKIFIFLYRLLQNVEYSSQNHTVGPYWLSLLYIVIYIYQHVNLKLQIYPCPHFSFGNQKFIFDICGPISILYKSSFYYVFDFMYKWWQVIFVFLYLASKPDIHLVWYSNIISQIFT